jgi:predicted transcriptional regulator of viral defense system
VKNIRFGMNRLTKSIIKNLSNPVFSVRDLAVLEPTSDNIRHALVKRAVVAGDMIRIRRGLYALSPVYRKTGISTFAVAQLIYGPSYVSLESALSVHGFIPEGVRDITCVTLLPSRDFETPIGHFTYTRVPRKILYAGVNRVTNDAGQSYMIASPLKALSDYVYRNKRDWTSVEPLIKSLRVEEEQLRGLIHEDFDELAENYSSRRVLRFLEGLKKELQT